MTHVAVLGLGRMGTPIAMRLIDAGHDVVVWNRSPEKAGPLVVAGATVARSPKLAAVDAEFVLTMLSDPTALVEVTEGDLGVLAGLGEGAVLIEMSTVGPAAVDRLARQLPASVDLVDAPVYGTGAEAQAGTLRLFVGGDESTVARAWLVLTELGTPLHVGPLGAGAAAKLVANTALFGAAAVLGEALALAEGLGLPLACAFEVLAPTPIGATAERRRPSIEANHYPARFALSMACKDLGLVLASAEQTSVRLPVMESTLSWFSDADATGWGALDYTAVLGRMLSRPLPAEDR